VTSLPPWRDHGRVPRPADDWIYLDHAATTPMRPVAVEAMLPFLGARFGNPSGGHALGRAARAALDEARERLAGVVGRSPGEIVFTGGGTEADNLAVLGAGDPAATPVCLATEHHAVLHPVEHAGGRTVPVDRRGLVDLDALAAALADAQSSGAGVSVVSIGLVNNEVGVVQDLDAVAAVVRDHAPGALLHTDAAQALNWLDVARAAEQADLVTLVAHKCGGPKGVGALVVRDGVDLRPLLRGGGQERDRRSGTQDVAGAVAFATAAVAASGERASLVDRARGWQARIAQAVIDAVPGAVETAVPDPAGGRGHVAAGWAHLCLPQVASESLLFALEHDHRILASAASSCASGAQEASHVLAAMGVPTRLALGSLRVSFGWSTTDAEVDAAVAALPAAAVALQGHAVGGVPV
jgi:cysteine desulfurase